MWRLAGRLPTTFDLAFSVPQDMPDLVRILDKVIASISQEEEKKLLTPWISLSVHEGVDLGLVLRWAGGIGTAVAMVILVIVAWNRRLGREVAERNRAEAALAEKEAQLRIAMDNMPGGMFMVDEQLNYQVFNDQYLGLMEYPDGVIRLGDPVVKGIRFRAARGDYGAGDQDELIERRLLGYSDRESLCYEERLPSGKIIEFVRRPVASGGMVAVATDITERKRAEEALRESEARSKAILNTTIQLQGLLESDGTLIEANAAALSMIDVSKEDVAGRLFWDCPWWTHNPDLQVQLRQAVKKAADGETVRFVATHPTPEGIEHFIDFRLTPITNETGEVVLIVPEGHDITDLKQAEIELRQAKEQAETALAELTMTQQQLVVSEKMASLGQLTAGIAHEIKNPLNFVNNFSETSVELLDELKKVLEPVRDQFDEDSYEDVNAILTTLCEDLERINHHGKRADSIVKSMLLHARGDSAEQVPTSVNDLVGEAFNLTFHGQRAQDKSFYSETARHFDDSAGEAVVVPQEIMRVLVNLFSNAFYAVSQRAKSEKTSGVAYRPLVEATTKDLGDKIQIRIRDNGTGIPEFARTQIFDPFFTTKPTNEGTGLGLSMSYDIVVQQHSGQMTVDSEPGVFTEFTITLPRQARAAVTSGDSS